MRVVINLINSIINENLILPNMFLSAVTKISLTRDVAFHSQKKDKDK